MPQCPYCTSHGVYPIKRHWWQRLLKRPNQYYCHDCGHDFDRSQVMDTRVEQTPLRQEANSTLKQEANK